MTDFSFPALSLDHWQPTRDTIHTYAQVVGKVRRALAPPRKHWWHISLRVGATALTTTPMPAGNKTADMLLDFRRHQLLIITSENERRSVPLEGQSAAGFCTETLDLLAELGIEPAIERSQFADDTPGVYDETAVSRFWDAFVQIDAILKQFRAGFRRESSPVQLWPHHFDLAVNWFSGRLVPDQDPDDPEYADEQMNFGFVTGDSAIADPYFFATAYPEPDAFTAQPLPADAYWHTEGFSGAILPYAALVGAPQPRQKLLNFLKAAHEAGAQFMQ